MFRSLLRWFAAAIILQYGFAKINGAQFTILDSELDKPMGQVSGFWLTWYYFGYSPFYGTLLALVQVAGALLLTFRRTALLGACILAPVLGNIVLIDLCYGVDLGATLMAFLLLVIMLVTIAPHVPDLLRVLIAAPQSESRAVVKWIVRAMIVVVAFGLTYWAAHYNNRLPTPLDGVWDVVKAEPASAGTQLPVAVFFEYNRAYMTVFKYADGAYRSHHFEVGPGGELKIWERWLRKGEELFGGNYSLAGTELRVSGKWRDHGVTTLTLWKRGPAQGDHRGTPARR